LCVAESVNRLGVVDIMHKIPFLGFTIQSIVKSTAHFTEIRATLTVAISMETLLIKYFKTSYFRDNLC